MKVLSIALAVIVSVLLSYALGTSAKAPDAQPSKPDTSAPATDVPCDSNARLLTGSFQPTGPVTSYRVTFEASGMGRVLWLPGPISHRSEIDVVCSQTMGMFCRYEYITDYIDPYMRPVQYALWYLPNPCASGQRIDQVRNYSVEILGP